MRFLLKGKQEEQALENGIQRTELATLRRRPEGNDNMYKKNKTRGEMLQSSENGGDDGGGKLSTLLCRTGEERTATGLI